MAIVSNLQCYSPLRLIGLSFKPVTSGLRRMLLTGLLISLFWLPGLLFNPALAMPSSAGAASEKIAQKAAEVSAEDDRTSALVACLPTLLSQPSLKRALSEMGNDQLERALHLKTAPKLSEAEVALASCLDRQAS